ncbi:MAG: gluconate 2-dehydrogenase subunit 3 family protein [Balneolaceae bacterium]|nr:gluconate 2-dehydrogenase subunit 3 family protein [Balneolaceae bacterium]MBO6547268.1 gluconate 2-dehydrogenase subunit 3 family protein [Balneolaceae bacterium]MBO6647785.1 gluconate 2-dehydrogenase subunit 3 family protein [Balneolaceae bacterium]
MKRREVIKFAAGALIGTPFLSSVLFGSKSIPKSILEAYNPSFFTEEQLKLVSAISDTILPKTDSPSASEVAVPQKIDSMISATFFEDQKKSYLVRFLDFEKYIHQQAGETRFWELEEEARTDILSKLDSSTSDTLNEHRWALWDLKNRTVNYYRNMQQIATNHLNYLPIPGYYDPCISLSETGGKAWAI